MTHALELEDTVAFYLDPILNSDPADETTFSYDLNTRWEMRGNKIPKEDNYKPTVRETGAFSHQEYDRNAIAIAVDNLLLLAEPGSGKTFLIGQTAEKIHDLAIQEMSNIESVMVLVKGPSQENDLRRLLVCKSTFGRYYTEKVARATTSKKAMAAAKKELKKYYNILRHETTGIEIAKLSDELLRNTYSNKLIFIDEIHNFRIDPDTDPFERNENYTGPDDYAEDNNKYKNNSQKIVMYRSIWRLTHVTKNCKIVGMTGTLVPNNVDEAIHILNLILPISKQLPQNLDMRTVATADLLPFLDGHISYYRAPETGITIKYPESETETIDVQTQDGSVETQIIYTPVYMSNDQSYAVWRAQRDIKNKQIKTDFANKEQQVTSSIFPDGTFGIEAGKKYTESMGKGIYKPLGNLAKYLKAEKLRIISAKNAKCLKIFKSHPNTVKAVFYEKVQGSGLIMLQMALEANGYQRFNQEASVFSSKATGYCYSGNINRELITGFKPAPRYAIIHKENSSQIDSILEVLGSDENIDGKLIEILLFSGMSKEGISVGNAGVYIQYGGIHTHTNEVQAKSRVYRITSHISLRKRAIQRLIDAGRTRKQAEEEAVVTVDEYHLCAIPSYKKKYKKLQDNFEIFYKESVRDLEAFIQDVAIEDAIENVDIRLYKGAARKHVEYSDLLYRIKPLALDCEVNYNNNVRSGDVPNTASMDFMPVPFTCLNTPIADREGINLSTHDVFFIQDTIRMVQKVVLDFFQLNFGGNLTEIVTFVQEHKSGNLKIVTEKHCIITLAHIITERIAITDSYGFKTYIYENRGFYYRTREYPLQSNLFQDKSLAYYGQSLSLTANNTLSDFISLQYRAASDNIIREAKNIVEQNDPEDAVYMLDRYTQEVSVEVLMLLIEDAIINIESTEEYYEIMHQLYRQAYYVLNEPIASVKEYQQKPASVKSYKPDATITVASFTQHKAQKQANLKNPIVYVHNLASFIVDRTMFKQSSNISRATGTIRIYKPYENRGWRDVNEFEFPVYNNYIRHEIYHKRKVLFDKAKKTNAKIFGTTIRDVFKIKDPIRTKTKTGDGKQCSNYGSFELARYAYDLGIRIKPKPEQREISEAVMLRDIRTYSSKDKNKKTGKEDIAELEKLSGQKLRDIFYLILNNKQENCNLIQKELEKQGLINRLL